MACEADKISDAMAMRVTAVFLSGKLCVLDVMPDITIGDLKEELKARAAPLVWARCSIGSTSNPT